MTIRTQLCLLLAATAAVLVTVEAKDAVVVVKGEKEFASLIKVHVRLYIRNAAAQRGPARRSMLPL